MSVLCSDSPLGDTLRRAWGPLLQAQKSVLIGSQQVSVINTPGCWGQRTRSCPQQWGWTWVSAAFKLQAGLQQHDDDSNIFTFVKSLMSMRSQMWFQAMHFYNKYVGTYILNKCCPLQRRYFILMVLSSLKPPVFIFHLGNFKKSS